MIPVSEQIPRDRFLPLPRPRAQTGEARRTGVEIEFAGLTEERVAGLVAARFGGTPRQTGDYEITVEGTELGAVQVYLDTALRKGGRGGLTELGLQLGREVIPVEIVTEPLEHERLALTDDLREALRAEGALGSGAGPLLGFGLHLNVQVFSERVEAIRPVLTAFALIEDWLRLSHPIDGSRRLLPFVDPYPRRLVRRLLAMPPEATLEHLMDFYLELTPTRNRSLDLLPLIRHLDEARLLRAVAQPEAVSARPTWHYRLPDSRVDEADWTIAYEWNRWVLVERVAEDADLLARLARGWLDLDRGQGAPRRDWSDRVETILAEADVMSEPA